MWFWSLSKSAALLNILWSLLNLPMFVCAWNSQNNNSWSEWSDIYGTKKKSHLQLNNYYSERKEHLQTVQASQTESRTIHSKFNPLNIWSMKRTYHNETSAVLERTVHFNIAINLEMLLNCCLFFSHLIFQSSDNLERCSASAGQDVQTGSSESQRLEDQCSRTQRWTSPKTRL